MRSMKSFKEIPKWLPDETSVSDGNRRLGFIRLETTEQVYDSCDALGQEKSFQDYLDVFADPAFQQRSCVKKATICPLSFQVACGPSNFERMWSSFIQGLGLMSNLRELTVECHRQPYVLRIQEHPCLDLHSLLSNLLPSLPNLRVICLLIEQAVEPNQVEAIAEMLSQSTNLEKLVIARLRFPHVWPTDTVTLDPVLHAVSKLKHLRKVQIGRSGVAPFGPLLSDEAVKSIASLPRLEEIQLIGMNMSSSQILAMFEGLSFSSGVKHVAVGECTSNEPERGYKPKVFPEVGFEAAKLMAGNLSIESLSLRELNLQHARLFKYWLNQAESFCSLNRCGRNRVFRTPNVPHHEWVNLMAAAQGDINALFHLLRRNPSLCCRARGPVRICRPRAFGVSSS